MKQKDLTQGNILKTMLLFALPMIAGNLMQQCYNLADTLIVGRFLGPAALAAVGSAYSLMTFLNSLIIGLCMGCGALYSMNFGAGDREALKVNIRTAFRFTSIVTILVIAFVFGFTDPILRFIRIPADVYALIRDYIVIIFGGIVFIFFYNYFAYLLRAVGNSMVPLLFLACSSVLNIVLDLWFVIGLQLGVKGAAGATVISQVVSGVGISIYAFRKMDILHEVNFLGRVTGEDIKRVGSYSVLTCMQQSVMNFGILMIQGLVNSFGTIVMAAFAAGVKIDTLAYMPQQEFGNAYSLFISQNVGAKKRDRVKKGTKQAILVSTLFSIVISVLIWMFASLLMQIFVEPTELEIIAVGVHYLRIEGAFYFGIGILFLWYGYYRGIGVPAMSLVLTIISLGTRVLLAYVFAPNPAFGVSAIWWAIPIGWILADLTGFAMYKKLKGKMK